MGALLSFADRLRSDLDILADRYRSLVSRSAIRNVDPNRGGSDVAVFIGFPTWDWTPDSALVAERTALRRDLDEWLALFDLLHRHRLPETASRIEVAEGLLRRWLDREGGDHSVPSSLDKAAAKADAAFTDLRALVDLADTGTGEVLAVPDTNVLLNDPDVATYQGSLGTPLYTVVLLPTVMSELDGLKDRGRTADVRDAASKALRRVRVYATAVTCAPGSRSRAK